MADDDYSGFIPTSQTTEDSSSGSAKLTEYGPVIDPPGSQYYDSNSYRGIGDRQNQLLANPDHQSVALTQAERMARFGVSGTSTGQSFVYNGQTYYDDDTAPEADRRIDVYRTGGSQNFGADYSGFNEVQDYSGFNPVEEKNDYAGFGSEILPTNHPQVQNGWTPFQSIKAIWDVGMALDANNAYGLVKQQSLQGSQDPKVQAQAQVPDDYDQQIRQVQDSPYLSPEDKQKNIAVLKEQQTRERDAAFLSLPDYQKKAIQTAQQVQKDNPQGWEKAVGSVGPYLKTMAGGPLAPIMAAQVATAETYGNSLDDNVKQIKKNHPEYDDAKALTEALEVANKDAQASGIATLAASGIDVPAAGPLIARIVQKIGVGAATMEVANTLAQVQRNMATKEHVDPNKEWFDGLNDVWFHVSNLATGAVFAGPHALGEIGRPSADPIEDRVPIAEVPEQPKTHEPQQSEPDEPERVVSAATKKGEEVRTGSFHGVSMGDWDPDDPEVEQGFTTNKGRFISRQEAHELASGGKQGSLYAEHLSTSGTLKEYKDPFEEAKQIVLDMHRKLGGAGIEDVAKELGVDPQEIQSEWDKLTDEGKIKQGEPENEKFKLLGLDPNNKVHQAIASLADKYDKQGIEKFVISAGKADDGKIIVSELGHGDVANKYAKQGGNPDNLRLGFVTNKGKFVRAGEETNMSGESADIRDEARTAKKAAPILEAYQRLSKQTGRTSVPITDLIKESGLPAEQVKAWLRTEVGDKGGGQLDEGDIGAATQTGKGDYVDFMGRKRTLADLSRMVQQPKPEPPSSPVPETEPWISAIANRLVQERQERGEVGAVEPGRGVTPEQMVAKGLAMGPEQIAQHVSDLMHDVGDVGKQAAAVRAREAQLSEESRRLGRIAEANPNDPTAKAAADEAFQNLTDFHKGPIAKLKNKWHQAGEAMQGEIPVDLSTFNGQRELWLRNVGKEPPKNAEETMKASAKKVRQAQAAETVAMKNLSEQIAKTSARRRLPTPDEVRDRIIARMKDDPCAT